MNEQQMRWRKRIETCMGQRRLFPDVREFAPVNACWCLHRIMFRPDCECRVAPHICPGQLERRFCNSQLLRSKPLILFVIFMCQDFCFYVSLPVVRKRYGRLQWRLPVAWQATRGLGQSTCPHRCVFNYLQILANNYQHVAALTQWFFACPPVALPDTVKTHEAG